MARKPTNQWSLAIDESIAAKELRDMLKVANARLALYEQIKTVPTHIVPEYKANKGQAVAIALLSDTHWEERVDPEDVPGYYNIYNPTIAVKRAEQMAQRTCLLADSQRHLTRIDDLVLAILGDLITGFLHDDNRESNYMPPPEAILFALSQCNSIIRYVVDNGGFERIIIPCCYGNHGRTTVKPRAKTAPKTNLEWMLYQLLAKQWANEPRVTFHIAEGSMIYLNIYDFVIRFMHGDHINFQGGIGGLCVPLLKAVHKLDQTKQAALTCLGHFHQASDFGRVVVNGSMIGMNAYALSKQIAAERAKQQFILMDRRRGKSLVADIFCDYLPERKIL